jgi:hypothetical protein
MRRAIACHRLLGLGMTKPRTAIEYPAHKRCATAAHRPRKTEQSFDKQSTTCTRAAQGWSRAAQPLHKGFMMNLTPLRPPGSGARKARAFSAEMARLRAQGYTFEAIREALAAAGVQVSNSTVQREIARAAAAPAASPLADVAVRDALRATCQPTADAGPKTEESTGPKPPSTARPATSAASRFANGPSGEEVAEAFMATQITNPFLRDKEPR